MLKCPKCNHEMDEGAEKCSACGQELPAVEFSGPIITNSTRGVYHEDWLGPYKFFAAWRILEKTRFGKRAFIFAIAIAIILAILTIVVLLC